VLKKLIPQKWLDLLITQPIKWYQQREYRERLMIFWACMAAIFIGLYSVVEGTVNVFAAQDARYNELQENIKRIPPLLARYNALKMRKDQLDDRFSGSNALQSAANLAHLERLIKRKAQVASQFEIRKGNESTIENQYQIIPFTIRFQQMTTNELSNFLRELASDTERPSVISRFSARTRGNSLLVELSVDFIAKIN
jgi:hypothetical protein